MKQSPPLSPRESPPLPTGAKGSLCVAALALVALVPAVAQDRRPTSPGRNATLAAAAAQPAVTPAVAAAPAATADGQQISETEIVATDGADFDSKGRIATFTKDVHVTDPRFDLHCDKLTVFLLKTTEKGANRPAAATPAPEPTPAPVAGAEAPKKDEPQMGGIERAVAEGHVIIVQRRAAETPGGPEKTSTGQGEKAVFVTKTGEMTLTGSPRVQQDINEHVATAPGTVMILGRDNTLRTFGPSKTLIRQRPTDPKPADGTTPAATPRPGRAGTRRG